MFRNEKRITGAEIEKLKELTDKLVELNFLERIGAGFSLTQAGLNFLYDAVKEVQNGNTQETNHQS